MRALRCAVLNVPKPTKVIGCPFFRDFVIPSMKESTAAEALDLVMPVSCAIFVIRSCLFIELLRARDRGKPVSHKAPREHDGAAFALYACAQGESTTNVDRTRDWSRAI